MTILIRGGRILDPARKIDRVGDLYIENGKIVKRCSLSGNTSYIPDCFFHLFRRHFLSMNCAGSSGYAFVHQSAADIIRSRIQTREDAIPPHLNPRGLNVFYKPMKNDTS